MRLPRMINPTVDVWSFGCVLSEALAWLQGGQQGLEAYRQSRRREQERLSPNFSAIEAFHDGGYFGGVKKASIIPHRSKL